MQVSCLVEVLRQSSRDSKGSEKNRKFHRGGGVNNFEIQRAQGAEHFGISEGKVGLKCSCRPWLGMDFFCDHPVCLGSVWFDLERGTSMGHYP